MRAIEYSDTWWQHYRGSVSNSLHLVVAGELNQLLNLPGKQPIQREAQLQPDVTQLHKHVAHGNNMSLKL